MKNSKILNKIKAFGMTNHMMLADLNAIEKKYSIDLGSVKTNTNESIEEKYFPQFKLEIRKDASEMMLYYETFYCLERSIRDIISENLENIGTETNWWESDKIPNVIKQEVMSRIQKEIDSGVTRRSNEEIDYTTFGELSQIIISNWDIFGTIFSSKKAVEKVMTSLNTLRGPIAHCGILSEDEILRLRLTVRDWFRLME